MAISIESLREFPHMYGFMEAMGQGKIRDWLRRTFPGKPEEYPFELREIMPSGTSLMNEILMFEVLGSERSGKSTLLTFLKERGIEGAELIVQDEFYYQGVDLIYITRGLMGEGCEAWASIDYSTFKLAATNEGIRKALEVLERMDNGKLQKKPVVLVVERGPHDVLAYTEYDNAIYETLTLPEKDELKEAAAQRYLQNFSLGLMYAELVTAAIFFQNSIETAMSRRVKDGLPKEGFLTNSRIRPKVNWGYGCWLGSFYPTFSKGGMGLKVIDGERAKEENNAAVLDYITGVVRCANNLLK